MKIDIAKTKEIIKKYRDKKGAIIPLLQDIQGEYGYVPQSVIEIIARELSVFPVEIYGVLTFYTQFYLTPRGKHTIKVCQGTACHVMGGKEILDYIAEKLEIRNGQTTKDGMFSLERVACLGCCGMAPVVMIDEKFYGRCTIKILDNIIKEYRDKK